MASLAERWVSGAGMNVPGVSPEQARRNRIASFAERAQRFPGVMGNGPTGVQDARGYSDMLSARRTFEDDLNAEEGKGPMVVRGAPMVERSMDDASGAPSAMRGLQMAMRGGGMGGGAEDDFGAGRTQRLANAVRQRDLESELLSPSSARPDLGENLSPEDVHSASAYDFGQKARARTAGQVYNMPEVAGPREAEQAAQLARIIKQYIEPAQIKADADIGAAELGYEGQRERATGQTDAARLAGAAAIRAAEARAGGQRSAAESNLLADLGSYKADPKALMGLIQALRDMGLLGGSPAGAGGAIR